MKKKTTVLKSDKKFISIILSDTFIAIVASKSRRT